MRLAIPNARGPGIEAFVKRERALLLSFVFLASALHLATQSIYVRPQRQLAADLVRVNALIEHENRAAKRLRLNGGNIAAERSTPAAASAAALTRMISAAAAHEVEVGALVPDGSAKAGLKTEIAGDFRSTVRVLARLEKMDLAIRGFEIAPATKGDTSRLQSSIDIEASQDSLALLHPHAVEVPELSALVDPFAQRACVASAVAGRPGRASGAAGLKLSAVTQMGTQSLATINGLDFAVGDTVGGYRVAGIGPDSVRLVGAAVGADACLVLSLPVILSGPGDGAGEPGEIPAP